MSLRFNSGIMFAILALTSISYLAIAGDRPKKLRDISPFPSRVSNPSIASTGNEVVTPIELPRPENVIDKAMSTPSKAVAEDVSAEFAARSGADSIGNKEVLLHKKPIVTKKTERRAKKNKKLKRKVRYRTKYEKRL